MALRRIAPEVFHANLGPLRMWRDDLAEIVAVLREFAGDEIMMIADDYQLDEVDDLAELARQGVLEIDEFSLVDAAGRVELRLGRAVSLLVIREPDLRAKGAVAEIARISNRCRRLVDPVHYRQIFRFALVAMPVLGSAFRALAGDAHEQPPVVAVLHTRRRSEAPTFWKQKRYDVWITLVSNVAALILGGVIGYFVNKIS